MSAQEGQGWISQEENKMFKVSWVCIIPHFMLSEVGVNLAGFKGMDTISFQNVEAPDFRHIPLWLKICAVIFRERQKGVILGLLCQSLERKIVSIESC